MLLKFEVIKNRIIIALNKKGLPMEQADILADSFVTASACGVDTHGIPMLKAYIKKLDNGEYNLSPSLDILKQTGSFAVVDADNSVGAYSAQYGMNLAIENAKKQGIYTVFSKNSNTYGPAFYYTKLASDNGLIGLTFCNTPTAMAPWNSKTKLFGTNPFAVSFPSKSKGAVLFDMATSKVAKSKINKARLSGEQIPNDWALDINGNPTTDPLEAIKGVVLPMAEYKGYGLAMSIDVLAGVLAGAGYMNSVGRFYSDDGKCMNVGQVFVAIDPKIVLNDTFYDEMDDYIDAIHDSQPISNEKVIYPGEHKNDKLKLALEIGLEVSDDIIEFINEIIEE